jgi:hypothetical protein
MPTKEDYPYLAFWKVRGFDKFPTIPPEEISRPLKERAREKFFEKRQTAPSGSDMLERSILSDLDQKVEAACSESFQANIDKKIYALGLRIVKAQIDHACGKNRDEILKELGQELFPAKRGGGFSLTPAHLKALKEVYREIREAIHQSRKENGLPLKKTPTFAQEAKIDLTLLSPWLNNFFNPDEIPALCKTGTISECALEIMGRRLIFTKKTLTRLLHKSPQK